MLLLGFTPRCPRHGIIIFALSLIGCFLAMASASGGEVIFERPWGEAPDCPGLLNREEVERCGPLSFSTDGENIVFLDSVKQRVIAYNKKGQCRVLTEKMEAWAICADGMGGAFIQNERDVIHLGGKEGLKRAYRLAETGDKKGSRLIEGYGNELMISPSGALQVRGVLQETLPVKGAPVLKARVSESVASARLQYSIKRMFKNEVRVLGLTDDGKDLVSFPVKLNEGYAGAVLFKGLDAGGNIYVELECIVGGRAELEVHRYSPDGKRLAFWRMPNNYFTTVYRKTEVAPDGSVYQMLTTPDCVQIIRYGREDVQ